MSRKTGSNIPKPKLLYGSRSESKARFSTIHQLIEQVDGIHLTAVHVTRNANRTLLHELTRLENLIRVCGFHLYRKARHHSSPWRIRLHLFYSLVILTINLLCFGLSAFVVYSVQQHVNLLSIHCISAVINSSKPLQVIFNIIGFMFFQQKFELFMSDLEKVSLTFSNIYDCRITVKSYLAKNLVTMVTLVAIAFTAQMSHYLLDGKIPGQFWLDDLSLLIAPLLVLWQILPLLVFSTLNGLVQDLVNTLRKHIKEDKRCAKHLEEHHRSFTMIARTMSRFNNAFEFYIIQTYVISIVNMSLAVYFVTCSNESLEELFSQELDRRSMNQTVFQYFWCCFQVTIAIGNIAVICLTASTTNERVESISAILLSSLPETDAERTLIFGIMSTFTLLMLRLQQSSYLEDPMMLSEVQNNTFFNGN